MEITNEFRLRAFGAYWNAEVEVLHNGVNTRQENPKVTGYLLAQIQHHPAENTTYKLLLTPLERITDEHAIEVARIAGITGEYAIKNGKFIAMNLFYGSGHNRNTIQVITTADQLRAWNYLIPFMGVDLVEAGVAKLK
jgi:hypothetical protein